MTAVAVSRPAGFRPARLLRLEIKHSPFLWALPVLAALFYYDTYRTPSGCRRSGRSAPRWSPTT